MAGAELAAGGVDVGAAGAADGGVDAELDEPVAERPDAGCGCAAGRPTRRRVERDQVHVGAQRPGVRGEFGGVASAVVHAVDQRPLERQPSVLRREVVAARRRQLRQRIAPVDRDELVAQFVVGGVQRHGKVHRQPFGGEAADARHDPDRRQRE